MYESESALGADYEAKVAVAAVSAVVDLFGAGEPNEGIVDPLGAAAGLAAAIAMIVHNTGAYQTPKARRELAEICRKHIERVMKQLDADAAGGRSSWVQAKPFTRN